MARENIITARVDDDELASLEERMAEYGYDQRGRYLRDAALGRIQDEYESSTPSEYERLRDRVQVLEEAVFDASTTEYAGDEEPPTPTDSVGDDAPATEPAGPTNGVTGQSGPRESPGLAESIRTQLPKNCSDADADAVVAIAEFLRDEPEQWASPQEIRDAVHAEYPAGKENPEWWWSKMGDWIEYVDEIERVHQRKVTWAGPEDGDTGGIYDPTEEF